MDCSLPGSSVHGILQARILHQFSSVAQLCPILCNPVDCSMPGFPAHHQLPEPAQTHVHQVSDAIQPSHPLSSPSPPVSGSFPMSQFFAWGSQSIGVSASALVLPMNIHDWFSLGWTGFISLQSKERAPFNFMAAVTIFSDIGAQENKVCHCLNCFPIFSPRSDGTKGFSRAFSNTTVQKHQFFGTQLYSPTLTSIHDYWKNHSFDQMDLYLLRILQWVAIPFSWGS